MSDSSLTQAVDTDAVAEVKEAISARTKVPYLFAKKHDVLGLQSLRMR